jgi:hypothetical protein
MDYKQEDVIIREFCGYEIAIYKNSTAYVLYGLLGLEEPFQTEA